MLAWLGDSGVERDAAVRAQLTSETDAIGQIAAARRSSSR